MAITKIGTTGISNNLDVPGYLYLSGDNKELRFYNGANYMILKASGSLSNNYTITLPVDDGTSGQFLKTDGGGVLSWDAAGGTTINGTTDNAIITYINSSGEFQAESTLKYDGAGTFTLANAATAQSLDVTTTGTAVTARIQLTSGASGTDGGTSLHFIEGSGNGAANNQQYFMGYRPGDNLFRFYSNSGQGVGSGGSNIFTIADGGTTVGFTGSIAQGAGARAHTQYGAIACLVTKSGNQTLPDTTETAITWNVESNDTDDGTASGGTGTMHDTSTNSERIYARTAGWYLVGATCALNHGYARMVLKHDNTWISNQRHGVSDVRFSSSAVDYFTAGTYFKVEMSQWSGGSKTIYASNARAWMIRIA